VLYLLQLSAEGNINRGFFTEKRITKTKAARVKYGCIRKAYVCNSFVYWTFI